MALDEREPDERAARLRERERQRVRTVGDQPVHPEGGGAVDVDRRRGTARLEGPTRGCDVGSPSAEKSWRRATSATASSPVVTAARPIPWKMWSADEPSSTRTTICHARRFRRARLRPSSISTTPTGAASAFAAGWTASGASRSNSEVRCIGRIASSTSRPRRRRRTPRGRTASATGSVRARPSSAPAEAGERRGEVDGVQARRSMERGVGGDLADDEDRDAGREIGPRADAEREQQRSSQPLDPGEAREQAEQHRRDHPDAEERE